jgi:hypothetical protein
MIPLALAGCAQPMNTPTPIVNAPIIGRLPQERIEREVAALPPLGLGGEEVKAYRAGYTLGLELGPSSVGVLGVAPDKYKAESEKRAWIDGFRAGGKRSADILFPPQPGAD